MNQFGWNTDGPEKCTIDIADGTYLMPTRPNAGDHDSGVLQGSSRVIGIMYEYKLEV